MNLFGEISSRYRALGVLAVTAALAGALGSGGPASAALSGGDWVSRPLPAGFVIGSDVPMAPVSCVAGTKFCLVVASNTDGVVDGNLIGRAPLVTTNGGRNWTGYGQLTSTFLVRAVSCPTTSECWAAGEDLQDKPAVAESTNGGQTWTDMPPPQVSSGDSWAVRGIDCPTTTTCYIVARDNPTAADDPAAAVTTDGGATWQVITGNLPTVPGSLSGTYELDAISCVTAQSCVAVGGLDAPDGQSVAISTDNGGSTWTMAADPELSSVQLLSSISCVPAPSGPPTCFAGGSAPTASGPVVLVSHDGGSTWGGRQVFDDTGFVQSIDCVTAERCWAATAGTTMALLQTTNGGETWSAVTSDMEGEDGSVSCLNSRSCVATTDGGLWITKDSGSVGTGTQRRPGSR